MVARYVRPMVAFQIAKLEDKHLAGGSLAKILGAVVIPEKAWTKHVGKLGKPAGAKTCKALEAALGHPIPSEIEEWLDLEGGKGLPESHDSGWYISALEVPELAKGAKGAAKALVQSPLLLLAGLAPLGRDASGDAVFVSLRPHPLGLAEPVLFNHENGEVEDIGAASIAEFLVDKWVSEDDYDEEYGRPGDIGSKAFKGVAAARKAFAARVKKALAKRDGHLAPLALWDRVHWLLGLIGGEPAFHFAEKLAKAPKFSVWTKEKPTLAKEPALALYWMLAHAFLGNDEACREAATIASKCKGWIVGELAATVLAFCDGKKQSPIEKLSAKAFADARALVAKNALPEQFAKRPKASPLDEALHAHDQALEALAKSDKAKADAIKEYLRERTQEAYNHYPYKKLLPDWLVPPAAAAFRAGLAVDLGHPRAYAGVSRALAARADHPDARAALIAALELGPADDRLGHAVDALVARDEPDAREAVRAAAWRWLGLASGIDEVLAKRQERFSLDDVFAKDDKLQPVVHAVLQRCDDEAQKLAFAISEAKLSFRVLKRTAGYMFRVYGKRGIADRYDRMEAFLKLLDEVPGGNDAEEPGVRLDTTASVAMAEASLALARIDGARARPFLEGFLARARRDDERRAGVAACVVPGLLVLDATHAEGLRWLERVLGARGNEPWIYGGLIAAREAKLVQAAPWVLPQAYISQLNSMMEDLEVLEREARITLDVLGAPAPLFDDTDEYAHDIAPADLAAALARWDRYNKRYVLERMRDAKSAAFVPAVAAFLEDRLRFSRYEPRNDLLYDELQLAIEYLAKHGARELARIRALDLGEWAIEMIEEA